MLATKRYEYLEFDFIQVHPVIGNHRPLDWDKVKHYEKDILANGLLEPLVVWEKAPGEFYLVGGFHRTEAIKEIRKKHHGYFDRVDVRIVAGDPDEIRALNLKLNADRVDTKISDFFDTIVHLNNANWEVQRMADFLDKRPEWIEEILRFAPGMNSQVRKLLEADRLSWAKAKQICIAVEKAPAGKEKEVIDAELEKLNAALQKKVKAERPLTFRKAKKHVKASLKAAPEASYTLNGSDLMALLRVLEGKQLEDDDLSRIREKLPALFEN